jgi:hypothetical protein
VKTTAFVGIVGEGRARNIAVEFDMLVGGVAEVEFELVDARQRRVECAFEVVARLLHLQVHGIFAGSGVARLGRVAVGVEIARHGQARIAPVADPRAAERTGLGAHVAVGQCFAGDVVVVVFAAQPVGMQRETVAAGIDAERFGIARRHAVEADLHASAHAVGRRALRNAAVDDVDHAADRARAVEQGGRALEDFDLVGEERFDRDRVVLAHTGDVLRAEAVAEHRDAWPVETADHGAADALSERGRLHARHVGDGLTDRAGARVVELGAREHADRRDDLVDVLLAGYRLHGDSRQFFRFLAIDLGQRTALFDVLAAVGRRLRIVGGGVDGGDMGDGQGNAQMDREGQGTQAHGWISWLRDCNVIKQH